MPSCKGICCRCKKLRGNALHAQGLKRQVDSEAELSKAELSKYKERFTQDDFSCASWFFASAASLELGLIFNTRSNCCRASVG